MKTSHGVIASALGLAGLFATACASSPPAGTKTAAQEMPAMEAAMRAASSVHIAGTLTKGAQKIGVDASINGSDFSGKLPFGGNSFNLIVVQGNAYVLLTAAYLKFAGLPSAVCSTACGKYLQVPASTAAQLAASFSMSHLMSSMLNSIPPFTGDTTDLFKPATFHGQPVLQFMQSGNTIDVARTGTPYPLFLSATGNVQGGLTFSDWNSVPPLTAPPASQIVNAAASERTLPGRTAA
jgi:hypothetical protein